jgi:tetratricopeptide (TPR) repeat protein
LRILLIALGLICAPLGATVAQQEAADPVETDVPAEGGIPAEPSPAADADEPSRADLSEAGARIRSGDYAGAEELLAALQSDFPDDPALLLMRGEVLLALRRVEEARDTLSRGAEVDPDRPRVHFQLATAYASLGQTEQALDEFGREIALNPDPDVLGLAHLNRSMLLQQAKRWGDAAAELEGALTAQPERTEVYGDLAMLYTQAGETAAAVEALERGRAAGFDSAQHYYSLGARLYNSKQYEASVTMLTEALRVDPALAEAERSLAAALERLGRDNEAVAHLRRYLELRPEAPDAAAVAERIKAAGSPAR